MISHEVNNTMGSVLTVLETLAEDTAGDPDLNETIESCRERCKGDVRFHRFFRGACQNTGSCSQTSRHECGNHRNAAISAPYGNRQLRDYLQQRKPPSPEIEKERMYVNADMPLLQQAIVNIVKNAVESISGNGNRDGVIHIATENENGSVTLTICNNGAEISEETASRLFQPVLLDKAFRTRAGAHGSVGGRCCAGTVARSRCAPGQDSLTRFTIRFPGQRGGEVPPSRECRQEASLQEYRALSR